MIEVTHSQSRWRPKRSLLIVSAIFSAVLGPAILLPEEITPQLRIIKFVGVICVSLLVLAWCYFDSLERHKPLYPWLRVVILFFGLFALFIYLFKSRGFNQGIRSVGMALLFCLGMLAVSVASAFLFAIAFGID